LKKFRKKNRPFAPGEILTKMPGELIFNKFFYQVALVCIDLNHINTPGQAGYIDSPVIVDQFELFDTDNGIYLNF
jgi:hypothetical protein